MRSSWTGSQDAIPSAGSASTSPTLAQRPRQLPALDLGGGKSDEDTSQDRRLLKSGPHGVDSAAIALVDDGKGSGSQWPYLWFTAYGGKPTASAKDHRHPTGGLTTRSAPAGTPRA